MATYPRSTCDFAGQADGTNLTAVPTGDGGVWRKHPSFTGDFVVQNIGGEGYVRRSTTASALYYADDGPGGYDQRVRCKFHVVTANSNTTGPCALVQPSANTYYTARWNNGSKLLELIRVSAGASATFSTAAYATGLVAGQSYWIELIASPSSQAATLYGGDGATVLATCSGTDSAIKVPGYAGFRTVSGGADTVSTGFRIGSFATESSPRTVEIAAAAPSPYASLRIPSVVATPNYLLCVTEARYIDSGDARPSDTLLYRIARADWDALPISPPAAVVLDSVGTDAGGLSHDACGVYVPATGQTLVFVVRYPAGMGGSSGAVAGLAGDTGTIWLYTSEDEGATWAEAVDITSQVKDPSWSAITPGPSNGFLAHSSGRLLGTMGHGRPSGVNNKATHVVYSDDHGATWQIGGLVSPENATQYESQLAELSNGDILCSIRWPTGDAVGEQLWYRSTDIGATWASFDPAANNPVVPEISVGLASADYGPTARGLVLHSGPNDAATRVNLSARYSVDRGVSWNDPSLPAASASRYPAGTRIAPGGCGYSCAASDPSGDFFVLYEHPQGGALALSRIDRAWLGVPEPPVISVGSPAAMMMGF